MKIRPTMYALTYQSKESHDLSSNELKLLLKTSSTKNSGMNITGCLIYYLGKFIQILEGEKNDVITLYNRIKLDSRHTKVLVFSEGEISERTFPEWGMAYYPVDKNDIGKNEMEQFRTNLALLSDLSVTKSVTAHLFWRRIKLNVGHPGK